jgi:LPXTG-motif cell wall-anchored protein
MADQATGTGFANIAGGIGSILNGLGGGNGIGDDIGNVINATKGNVVPQNVTYVNGGSTGSNPSIIWIVLGAAVLIGMIFILKKKNMFQAIAAVISAVFGFASGIVSGTNAKYLQRQSEYQASIDYERQKNLALYDAYGNEAQTRNIIIAIGIVSIVVMVYLLNKRK